MTAGEQHWRELTEPIVAAAGFDLEDFAVISAGRRRLVRVVIDSDDGVPLDAAADVSRRLSEAFDADEESGGRGIGGTPYTLEVTSPGIGRPLTAPAHFHRARGRLVELTVSDGRTVVGRVLGITDDGVDLLTGKGGIEPAHVRFADIARAKVQVDFAGPSAAVAAALAADPRSADAAARQAAQHAESLTGSHDDHDDADDDAADDDDDVDAAVDADDSDADDSEADDSDSAAAADDDSDDAADDRDGAAAAVDHDDDAAAADDAADVDGRAAAATDGEPGDADGVGDHTWENDHEER